MDERTRRIGMNEALFRQVNERIESLNRTFATFTDTIEIICECGNAGCAERISMSVREYEELRADPALVAVVKGHEAPDVERVVESRGDWDVVRKHEGDAERLARATDPRG